MISYSQNFEDVILERYFKDKNDGFYIDIGAADPKIHSVTKHFYDKGWHGINVEPSPVLYGLLQQERTRDINLNIVVCEQDGLVEFFDIPKTGLSSINKEYVDSAMNNILQLNYDGNKLDAINTSLLESSRLENLFEKYTKNVEVDFLKIDVEGAEEQVIKSNNWSLFRPKVLVIEATLPNTQIESYKLWEKVLLQADYSFVYFDGLNRFYLRDDLAEGRKFFSYPPCVFDDFTRSSEIELQKGNHKLHSQQNELQIQYQVLNESNQNLYLQLEELHRRCNELQTQNQVLNESNQDLYLQLKELQQTNDELEFINQKLTFHANELMDSYSWRITRPLRLFFQLLIDRHLLPSFAKIRNRGVLKSQMKSVNDLTDIHLREKKEVVKKESRLNGLNPAPRVNKIYDELKKSINQG